MSLLTCKNLTLGYEGSAVLEDLTFSVESGDYLCIVGENGSGKSTLIKTLLKLMPPISGEIELGEGLLHRELGYLPQQTVTQRDFPASVGEIVRSGCLGRCGARPFFSKEEKALADSSMEKLGIKKLKNRCYRELSGGQQQKVLLARALCATRRLLILDEPVAGLDPNAMAEMYEIIHRLNLDDKITIIMISHDIASSLKYASHVLHLGSSKPLFFGTRREYIASDIGRAFAHLDGGKRYD